MENAFELNGLIELVQFTELGLYNLSARILLSPLLIEEDSVRQNNF